MKAKVGDKIKMATYQLIGEAEVIKVYKSPYGHDMMKIRQKADNLGNYNYYEIWNEYNKGWFK